MTHKEITWSEGKYGTFTGKIASITLFDIEWSSTGGGYLLRSHLPIKMKPHVRFSDPDKAKMKANELLMFFLTKVTA